MEPLKEIFEEKEHGNWRLLTGLLDVIYISVNREEAKKWIAKVCGTGWLTLIDEVYNNLPKGIKITQVYQKWGLLKFDPSEEHPEFEKYLEDIELKSSKMCEKCGLPALETIIDGWVTTLCDNHYNLNPQPKYKSQNP